MQIKNIILVIILSMLVSSCSLWPYKKGLDCPIPDVEGCLSTYEVIERVESGFYEPNNLRQETKFNRKSKNIRGSLYPKHSKSQTKKNNKSVGYCHAC